MKRECVLHAHVFLWMKGMSIHKQIVELLMERSVDHPLNSLIAGMDVDEVCTIVFVSPRIKANKGLRLTDTGIQLMKAFFKSYDVKMCPGYVIKTPHIIYMDRINRTPYWFSDKYCVLFDTDLAMMLTMSEGNIQTLIESRFRLSNDNNSLAVDF